MIRCVLIDDEAPARRLLRLRLEEELDFAVVGEAADGAAAVDLIRTTQPQVAFLDIQMPQLNGLEVVRALAEEERPLIVHLTAHQSYAVEAFAAHALDYLLKPITSERWRECLHRVRARLSSEEVVARQEAVSSILLEGQVPRSIRGGSSPSGGGYVSGRSGERWSLLRPSEILRIEAARNYVRLVTTRGVFTKRVTMVAIAGQLPENFARVHRSTIVNLDEVVDIRREWHGDYVILATDGQEVRMSRRYASTIIRWRSS